MPTNRPSLAMFTDLYELTMAQAYWQNGTDGLSTFSLFFRNYPPDRGYFVFAGLPEILDYLDDFGFTDEDIEALRTSQKFDDEFLDYLSNLRFTGNIRSMREGTIFFANEPVVEITAPIIEAQLAETYLVNQINIQTILATKCSRVVHAAEGRTVVDFGARRTHGINSANSLARVSYIVGFAGTSNVLASALYNLPTFGTMAHSFITAYEDEAESFRAYARSFPDTSTFLVDTYDTVEGTRKAIEVAKEMKLNGHDLRAIRLDSGDLLNLSVKTRQMLDDAGLNEVQVFASGGLDEFEIDDLIKGGAKIDGFGVGTKVAVSADAPWTDCAYKLVEYDGRSTMKLSASKEGLPGPKQVYRLFGEDGNYGHDIIGSAHELRPSRDAVPLLHNVMEHGKRTAPLPKLEGSRAEFALNYARLPDAHKAIRSPEQYSVVVSDRLQDTQKRLIERIQSS